MGEGPRAPNTLVAALLGRCPRCGEGRLFAGYLAIPPACSVCGLDFSEFDPGDGPAVFVMLIVGAIVCALALWVEVTFSPPFWVHAVLWLPMVAVLTLVLLRWAKGLLVVLQYRNEAHEGRPVK